MSKGVNFFNFIWQDSSAKFKEAVPQADEGNISVISNILFNQGYSACLNEFVDNLINRLTLTKVDDRTFRNPLALLKKGSNPLGTDIQTIYTNPAEAEQYVLNNEEAAKLLAITDPDTKVAYYRRNRKDRYEVTVAEEALQAAFASWDKFGAYVESLVNSLYSGNYIDEFAYTKKLVAGAYAENKAIINTISKPSDESTAKAFIKAIKKAYRAMKFPSSDYNAYSRNTGDNKPAITWTTPERVVLVVRGDVLDELDVDALASAFQLDRIKFEMRVLDVDKFDEDGKVLAVLCDESFFQIYDNVMKFKSFENGRALAWNYYLHVWQTFAISPFANSVIFATEAPAVAYESVDFGTDAIEIDAGDHEGLDMTVAPVTGNGEITYAVTAAPEGGATTDLTLTPSEDDRHVDIAAGAGAEGEYTVTASTTNAAGETVTDTLTVTVTAAA